MRHLKEIDKQELLLAGFRERSPSPEKEQGYKEAQAALDAAKAAMSKRREEIRPRVVEQVRDHYRYEQQERRALLSDKVEFLNQWEKRLKEEIDTHSKHAKAFTAGVVDVQWLQDEISQLDSQ